MPMDSEGARDNLEELRARLTRRAALLLACLSGAVLTQILLAWPFPLVTGAILLTLTILGWRTWATADRRPGVWRRVLVWGMTAVLLASMALLDEPWMPFIGLVLVQFCVFLVQGAQFLIAVAVGAFAVLLVSAGVRTYPLAELGLALAFSAGLAWLTSRTLYTGLEWAWTMQQRADHLLEVSRDSRGELGRALNSLDKTAWILRRTRRELIAARQQADEARRMKEQFAANVSHELRTPLNIILGFSEIMHNSPEVYGDLEWPDALKDDVAQIHASSRHLLGMIDDVLDLSRLEMVGFTLKREPVNLGQLLRRSIDIISDMFRDRQTRLEIDIPESLPTMEVDPTRIRQVALNLLNNAARFAEGGEVRLTVSENESEVVVSVTDTGPGIPADLLPHLFQEFYQVDMSLRRRHEGAGLGLAISKHFVEAHDGRIWVESQEGVGSTFHFALPKPGQKPSMARLGEGAPLTIAGQQSGPILVVDPDPGVATFIRRHLVDYDVVAVADGAGLDQEVERHHPLMVVRNRTPGEPVDERETHALPVPVVECTLPSQAWIAQDLSVASCIRKPISSQDLIDDVKRFARGNDILVVDDDPGFCGLVERILHSDDAYRVRRACSGEEGMRELLLRPPDVLLLDLIMPPPDGFEILERMRHSPGLAGIPVILLTATSYAEDNLRRGAGLITVHRPGGFSPAEALRHLKALADSLSSHGTVADFAPSADSAPLA